jgi:hypothetical protein
LGRYCCSIVANRAPQNLAIIDITYISVENESEIAIAHKAELFLAGAAAWVVPSFFMDKRTFCLLKRSKIGRLAADWIFFAQVFNR